ncbi:hypothetical protein OS493_023828 [Desmophyllum pertusum]|uniref:Uncharacterized protein n=1 Tax=Desmophyllum pertusum TaxID=174260 RepID=A0A9W9YLW6_9CNID|nr:hypothetical protein OS493_023828 [Desmophyllum pertusum]
MANRMSKIRQENETRHPSLDTHKRSNSRESMTNSRDTSNTKKVQFNLEEQNPLADQPGPSSLEEPQNTEEKLNTEDELHNASIQLPSSFIAEPEINTIKTHQDFVFETSPELELHFETIEPQVSEIVVAQSHFVSDEPVEAVHETNTELATTRVVANPVVFIIQLLTSKPCHQNYKTSYNAIRRKRVAPKQQNLSPHVLD